MIEVVVGRGDAAEARELVAAMRDWVTEGFGPTTQSMTTAMRLYESAGYRPIPDSNGNSDASFWGEKQL